jgi:hypothetical protein
MTNRVALIVVLLAAGLSTACSDDETASPVGTAGSGGVGGSGGAGGVAGGAGGTAGMGGGACAFGEPVAVDEINTNTWDYGPSISNDGLSLYLTSDRAGVMGPSDIWMATRASVNDPFGAPANLMAVNSVNGDAVPDVSSDGLTLYFGSDRTGSVGSQDIWMATRASTNDPFGAPANVAELNTADWDSAPSISADGLTIFIMSDRAGGAGGQDIWMATRPSTSDPFGAPTNVAEINSADIEASPNISADSLTLYFNSDRAGGEGSQDIWMATRADVNTAFDVPVNVAAINTTLDDQGPDISDDGQTMYFNRTLGVADIMVSTWSCP